MAQPEPADKISRLVSRAARLRLDARTAEAIRSLDRAGVHVVLLKGPSIAHWLYDDGEPRPYLDCDLLVAPADIEVAEAVLASLQYERQFDDRGMPSWWREHASAWVRDGDGVTVDLHRTLPGVGVDAEAAWVVLSRDSDVVLVGGHPSPTLGLPARALHIALHAAQHGSNWAWPVADLERALAVGDDDLWQRAAQLAAELDAIDAFAIGLRLTTAGVEVADRLALPRSGSVCTQLRATSPPPVALGFEQLAQADDMRARFEIAWRKIIPPANFIRHWDSRAVESRSALLRAYLRRPVWILRHSPRGLRAWCRARRAIHAARPRSEE